MGSARICWDWVGEFLESYCEEFNKLDASSGRDEETFFKKFREGNENEEILLKEHLKTIQSLMSFYQSQGSHLTFNSNPGLSLNSNSHKENLESPPKQASIPSSAPSQQITDFSSTQTY